MDWDTYFLSIAKQVKAKSKDPSTKVGAIIVNTSREIIATGYNGFPRGAHDNHRLDDQDTKYKLIVHAEQNAICSAARRGISLVGGICYVTMHPCVTCSKLLIQAGIIEVVHLATEIPERWADDVAISASLLEECKIHARSVKDRETEQAIAAE